MSEPSAGLTYNRSGTFYDGWITLTVDPQSPCIFTRGLRTVELPVRHGEGRLVLSPAELSRTTTVHLAPVSYADPTTGTATTTWPLNPNGSEHGFAGLCDPTGRIFGLMPHPEAFLYAENHPRWRERAVAVPDGQRFFENAINYCRGTLHS
jgi:phosphoribosylformylglycinamidine synthase